MVSCGLVSRSLGVKNKYSVGSSLDDDDDCVTVSKLFSFCFSVFRSRSLFNLVFKNIFSCSSQSI